MTPAEQSRIDDVFCEAMEFPEEQRIQFVKETCRYDPPSVREKILNLVGVGSRLDEIKPVPLPGVGNAGPNETDPMIGTSLGPYQVIRRLGRGGFGVVYQAIRIEPFEQKVAIKLLRLDRAFDEEIIKRFRQEQELLASLRHKNICSLLDGGQADDGRTYFVMDYIEGHPIDQYCDDHRLTIDERLKLFRDVCDAVMYVHRFSVIHRDIKPANILVDEDGIPFLLDFGISKIVDLRSRSQPDLTIDSLPLTPEFASPEQVRGELVSTVSDVYSLGVVLFKLLTGKLPYTFPLRTKKEIERIVCDQKPLIPSSLMVREHTVHKESIDPNNDTIDAIAKHRKSDLKRLQSTLKGDLDTVALAALRKDADLRYKSVEEFSSEIGRFLEGKPVRVRPIRAPERLWRWAKRNPTTSFLAASLAFVLVVAVATTSYLAVKNQQKSQLAVDALVNALLSAPPDQVPGSIKSLQSFQQDALPGLRHAFNDSGRGNSQRVNASYALAAFDEVPVVFLVDSIETATSDASSQNIVDALTQSRTSSLNELANRIKIGEIRNSLKARYALTRFFLGESDAVVKMLTLDEDPADRYALIKEFQIWNFQLKDVPSALLDSDVDTQSGLCLAIGHVNSDGFDSQIRTKTANALKTLFHDSPAGRVRSASRWALREWKLNLNGEPSNTPKDNEIAKDWVDLVGGVCLVGVPKGKLEIEERVLEVPQSLFITDCEIPIGWYSMYLDDPKAMKAPGWTDSFQSESKSPQHPAHFVRWCDAVLFCNWASDQAKLQKCYSVDDGLAGEALCDPRNWSWDKEAIGYRLPTKEEWEYACRSMSKSDYFFGNDLKLLDSCGWYISNSSFKSNPIRQLMPNGFGLFDVHGNVCEWCWDAAENPGQRIVSGGHFFMPPDSCFSASSTSRKSINKERTAGFRIVRNAN